MPGTGTPAQLRSGERQGLTAPQQVGGPDSGAANTAGGVGAPTARAERVGHDLQTPVAIVLGLCERVEAQGVNAAQAADLDRIRAQAHAIAAAAAALTQARAPHPQPLRVDAGRLTREVAGELAVLAGDRGASICVDVPRSAWVHEAEGRLRAAITNLVANAVRQVGRGGMVRCTVSARGPMVAIEIADSGPGVPPAERAAVLRAGVQGSGTRGRSGLGLSIVSDAAAVLGGSVEIDDAPEGGAVFRLAVPRARHEGRRRRAAG